MQNTRFRSYKKIIFLLILLVCGILFWFFSCRARTSNEPADTWEKIVSEQKGSSYSFETSYIKGTFTYGILGGGNHITDTPVYLDVCSKQDSFAGTMKITLPGTEGKGISYQSAVHCSGKKEERFVVQIPDLYKVSYFQLEILNQYGEAVLSRLIVPDKEELSSTVTADGEHIERVYIGILSNSQDAFEDIDSLDFQMDDKKYEVNVIRYNKESFPEDVTMLQGLSMIIIDDFPTTSLRQKQSNCLFTWVSQEGGSLCLGTGSTAGLVLSGLKNVLHTEAGESYLSSIVFTEAELADEEVNVWINDMDFSKKNFWDESGWTKTESCYKRSFGEGQVVCFRFSLTDHALTQWTNRNDLYRLLIKDALSLHYQSGEENQLWYIYRTLGSSLASQVPNTVFYGAFFILYIFWLAVLGYQLLRRNQKSEYIWLVVPGLSVLFLGVLLLHTRSTSTSGSEAFSAVHVVDYIDKMQRSYMLYRNEDGEKRSIKVDGGIDRVEAIYYDFYSEVEEEAFLKSIKSDYTINDTPYGYEIDFNEAIPGYDRVMKLNWAAKGDFYEEKHNFGGMFVEGDYYFKGYLINNSSCNYERVVLIRGNQYQIIKDLKAGENRLVDENNCRSWTMYDENNEEDTTFDEETMPVLQNILKYVKQTYLLNNTDSNHVIIAAVTSDRKYRILSDNHEVARQLSLIVDQFDISKEENVTVIHDLNALSDTKNKHYQDLLRGILSEKEITVAYHLDPALVVDKLMRLQDNYTGKIYAYNYASNKNEQILKQCKKTIDAEHIKDYLTSNNEIRITYKMDGDFVSGPLPNLSAVLKEIHE